MKNHSIDKLKAVACYLVVLNHFHPGGVLGDITYAISHFGVPVFFVVSGFFFLDKNGEISAHRLMGKIKHIGLLFLGHICLYTFYEIASKLVAGESLHAAIGGLKQYFNATAFVKAVALGTGIMGGGEWFLVSLIDAYVVLGLFMMWKRARDVLVTYAHIIAVLLFLTHIPVRMYLVKAGMVTLGPISLIESYAVRNTWLDAIPFLLIGLSIKKHYQKINISHPMVISAFALIIAIGERFYNSKMIEPHITHDVLYFGIIIAVVTSFICAVNNNEEENWLARIGCRYSMIIYFLHPIVGWILQGVMGASFINNNMATECFFSVVVMCMTTVIAAFVVEIKKRLIMKG